MDNLLRDFRDPPLEFRGAPFWSWNDTPELDALSRQAHDMKAHRMGGFIMHARDGLQFTLEKPFDPHHASIRKGEHR